VAASPAAASGYEPGRRFSEQEAALELSIRSQSRIERLRQSILKWAFEGKLVDQEPSDEPASVLLDRIRAERETAAPPTGAKARSARCAGAGS